MSVPVPPLSSRPPRRRVPVRWVVPVVLVALVVPGWLLLSRRGGEGGDGGRAADGPVTTTPPPPARGGAAECLRRPAGSLTSYPPRTVLSDQLAVPSPPDGHTYDLRNVLARSNARDGSVGQYPLIFGRADSSQNLCVVGGTVRGEQSRDLSWREMKTDYDGDGLQIKGVDWVASYGLRVDNVEDGFSPRPRDFSRDRWVLANAYMTYIRDDAVENDGKMSGLLSDSLIDGTYQFHSSKSASGETNPNSVLTVEDTLVRLEQMPVVQENGDTDTECSFDDVCDDGKAHGGFFKGEVGRVEMRDTILMAEERQATGARLGWEEGTYENVTLVWLGGGDYPSALPAGVSLTRDRGVWDRARAEWLRRHGCPPAGAEDGRSCTRLLDPEPPPRP